MDFERLVSALNHKPMNGIALYDPANLALKFFQCAHDAENGSFPNTRKL